MIAQFSVETEVAVHERVVTADVTEEVNRGNFDWCASALILCRRALEHAKVSRRTKFLTRGLLEASGDDSVRTLVEVCAPLSNGSVVLTLDMIEHMVTGDLDTGAIFNNMEESDQSATHTPNSCWPCPP